MPTLPGVLRVGNAAYLVGEDSTAVLQAVYPDAATAMQGVSQLAQAAGLGVMESELFALYALPTTPVVARTGVQPPPHPVPPNHPSRRGLVNG